MTFHLCDRAYFPVGTSFVCMFFFTQSCGQLCARAHTLPSPVAFAPSELLVAACAHNGRLLAWQALPGDRRRHRHSGAGRGAAGPSAVLPSHGVTEIPLRFVKGARAREVTRSARLPHRERLVRAQPSVAAICCEWCHSRMAPWRLGAGGDNDIDHINNWLRFTYDSTLA
jgi:hypothetical protein|eukprot:COSAG01_NODE_12511_length_1727_cov_1.624079_2_plen_170_part_00